MLIEFRTFELKEKDKRRDCLNLKKAGWKVNNTSSDYWVLFTKEMDSIKDAVIELESLLPDTDLVEDLWYDAHSHTSSLNNLIGVDLLKAMYPEVCPGTMREAVEMLDHAVECIEGEDHNQMSIPQIVKWLKEWKE